MPFPPHFLEHLNNHPGFDREAFELAHLQPAPVSIRLHPRKNLSTSPANEIVPWCQSGRYLPERPDFTLDPSFHAGAYYVQEASSMSIESVLDAQFGQHRNLRILDLCAAPGGKSTLLASWLNAEGLLVANEVIRTRASILKENLDRWGYANVVVSNNDPRQFGKLEGFFDVIVVDAPCSGSGMFRKDPASMKHWSDDAVEHCAARQQRILEDIWPALKTNGLLLYSTCSYSATEDEDITQFAAQTLGAEVIFPTSLKSIPEIVKSRAGFRFYPDKLKGEGFYLSVLQKTTEQDVIDDRTRLKLSPIPDAWNIHLASDGHLLLESHLGLSIFPEAQTNGMGLILKHLHVLKAGVLAGEVKGKSFIPDHELAMSILLSADQPGIDLSREEALRYLKKEAIPNRYAASGWQIVRYEKLALGWGNALPNRINNGLPKSWRILKDIGL